MYKRPPLRVKDPVTKVSQHNKAPVGSFIHKLLNPPPTVYYEKIKQPVYQKEAYLALLKKNNEELGIPWVERDIPEYEPPKNIEKIKEPKVTTLDRVYINLKVLKNGLVRIKLNTSFYSLYEKYYSQNKIPPLKTIIQAYKSHGYSQKFLDGIKTNHQKRLDHGKKISKAIDLIFNKEQVKKPKKKKEDPKPDEENVIEDQDLDQDQDQDLEDDEPEEDEAFEVENEDDNEEQQEEEYFSDGED